MKKVLLAVLCAGLFFACGNKKQAEPEALLDTVPAEEVVEDVVEEVVEPVEEAAPVAATTPKKAATPAKKNNTGMQASKKNDAAPTVEEQAKNAANRVAGKAIEKAETEATNTIVNTGKKKR